MIKRLIIKGLIGAGILWGAVCGMVYFFPQYVFYHPSKEKAVLENAKANDFAAEEVLYRAADDQMLYGWFIKPQSKKKVIVYFHGNSDNIEHFYHKLTPLVEAGYGAFIGEYRGFGGIDGKPSQRNLEMDAVAAIDYLHSKGYKNKDIILYGMSLGSHAALVSAEKFAEEGSFSALILEVPFDSLLNVAKQRVWPIFPFQKLIKDVYDNTALMERVSAPVLIMAGTRDKTVPIDRAKALFERAKEPKKLIIYSGAEHSSLYTHRNWRDILEWLKGHEKTK